MSLTWASSTSMCRWQEVLITSDWQRKSICNRSQLKTWILMRMIDTLVKIWLHSLNAKEKHRRSFRGQGQLGWRSNFSLTRRRRSGRKTSFPNGTMLRSQGMWGWCGSMDCLEVSEARYGSLLLVIEVQSQGTCLMLWLREEANLNKCLEVKVSKSNWSLRMGETFQVIRTTCTSQSPKMTSQNRKLPSWQRITTNSSKSEKSWACWSAWKRKEFLGKVWVSIWLERKASI